jgi:hypothetical protein
MKLRSQTNLNSIPPPISKHEVVHPSERTRADDIYQHYEHPWYKFNSSQQLKKPNPPTEEAIKKAQFVDKTYQWKKDR